MVSWLVAMPFSFDTSVEQEKLVLGHPDIFLSSRFLIYRKPYKAKLGLTGSFFFGGFLY